MSIDRRSFVAAAASVAASAAVRRSSTLTIATDLAANRLPAQRPDDPLGVRGDFPILAKRTFLNSAYAAPIPRPVQAAGEAFLEYKATQPFVLGDALTKNSSVRAQFASLINASPDEVGLLFSTTDGENVVANGLDLRPGDNVVINELHYPTEFVLYRELEASKGIELRIVKHRDGALDVSDFEPHVDRKTRIVSVAWVSHQNGFRHDMRPIADLAHAHGAFFYTDAIQAVGMFPIDVRASGVDALCSGTYKWLLAGFGVAPFFIRSEMIDRLRLDRIGDMHVEKELPDHHYELYKTAKRFDYSSRAFGEVQQLGAGLTYLDRVGVARIEGHTVGLAQRLHDGLVRQGYRMFTPPGNRSSIVVAYLAKPEADVRAAFAAETIDITVRNGTVRIAPALFNTTDDIDRCLEVTKRLA